MNKKRHQALVQGLNGVAQKVYEAVPIDDEWDVKQIAMELYRQSHRIEIATIEGCVRRMVASGLVQERSVGHFSRVVVRETEIPAQQPIIMAKPQPLSTTQDREPKPLDIATRVDAITKRVIALRLRQESFNRDFQEAAKGIARDIEELGLAVLQEVESAGKDAEKARRLKSLLQEIGV